MVAKPQRSTDKTAAGVGGDIVCCDCAPVDGTRPGFDGVSLFPEYGFVDSSGLESAGVRNANASGLCAVVCARTGAYLRIRTWLALAAAVVPGISERERRIPDSTFIGVGGGRGGNHSNGTPKSQFAAAMALASRGFAGWFDVLVFGSAGNAFRRAGDLDGGSDAGKFCRASFSEPAGKDSNRAGGLAFVDGVGSAPAAFLELVLSSKRWRSNVPAPAGGKTEAAPNHFRADGPRARGDKSMLGCAAALFSLFL